MNRSLSRDAYWNDDFYERECERIFRREWFLIGRSEQLPEAGAYRVVEVAGESLILIRDERGLHAHLNFCRHRGSRLLCGEGTLRGAIRCPYHAWAYAPSGELLSAPFIDREELPPDAARLHRVPTAEWGGFVFARLDEPPPGAGDTSLPAQLGAAADRVQRYPLAALRTVRSLRYEVAANWKVILENYNECYHCAGVHPELCRVVPAFKQRGGANLDWENGIPHREGAFTFSFSGTTVREPFARLDAFERIRHKGELIYPNLMLSLAADHVAAFTLFPQSPGATTVVCDMLFHPDEMKKPGFDPADAVDFWDLVNRQDWTICESVQAGMRSRAFRFGYYAPMEDASLDIRRYLAERLGPDA